jgi:hypothetical protein
MVLPFSTCSNDRSRDSCELDLVELFNISLATMKCGASSKWATSRQVHVSHQEYRASYSSRHSVVLRNLFAAC